MVSELRLVYYSHRPAAAHCRRFCRRHRRLRRRRRRRSCSFDRRPDGFVRLGQAIPTPQRSPPSEFSRASTRRRKLRQPPPLRRA